MRRITTSGHLPLSLLAAVLLLTSCDSQGPPSACVDAADGEAAVVAQHRLARAQDEIVRLRIGGSPYVAAKVGPLPDLKEDPDAHRAIEALRREENEFAAVLERCRVR